MQLVCSAVIAQKLLLAGSVIDISFFLSKINTQRIHHGGAMLCIREFYCPCSHVCTQSAPLAASPVKNIELCLLPRKINEMLHVNAEALLFCDFFKNIF